MAVGAHDFGQGAGGVGDDGEAAGHRFTRREAEDRIKILGGNVASAVTRKTDYLVAGASPGSKVAAAGRLGTEILDEAAFLELMGQALTEPVA